MLKIDNNVAQTGLRVLFVMQLLIKGPASKAQILEQISKNPYLKDVASDTITLDINTLKSVGFEIIPGNKGNNYCYELKLNPIKIKLSKREMRAISLAKKVMFHFMDFRYIISIYDTFKKVSKLIESQEQSETILNFGNILKTNFEILRELEIHTKHNNEICVAYNSPSGNKREMSIRCLKLDYSRKNDKLYLWGECDEYGIVYLRTDHIKKITKISKINSKVSYNPKKCTYSISNTYDNKLNLGKDEKILKITPGYIRVEENYMNDFYLKQKLLSYGEDLLDIEDNDIKKQVLKIIQEVEEIYS